MHTDNSYVLIDLDALRKNYLAAREKAGVPVMAVIKANAYGHGAVQAAKQLQDICGFFGVSSLSEALELRQNGIETPILILGHIHPSGFSQAIKAGIRVPISCREDAAALSAEAVKQNAQAHIHLAVDTGMGRIGFQPTEEAADVCQEISRLPGIRIEGVFSHFATADSAVPDGAMEQAKRFDAFCDMLRRKGLSIPLCHLNNSAGIINFSRHYDMVRAGIILYGLLPSDEVAPSLPGLTPVMRWHSRITFLKTLPAGSPISYGGTFVTSAPTRVATVSVGYADGYPRSLSNRFYVLIHGKKAPILGRVCMDQIMVDVTQIPEARTGDEVVLLGKSGSACICAQEIAQAAGSFHYEFVCGVGHRVPRYFYRNGQPVEAVNYLLDTQK